MGPKGYCNNASSTKERSQVGVSSLVIGKEQQVVPFILSGCSYICGRWGVLIHCCIIETSVVTINGCRVDLNVSERFNLFPLGLEKKHSMSDTKN